MSNHRNEDTIVEQKKKMDEYGDSSCLGTNEDATKDCTPPSTPEENVPCEIETDHLQNPVECVPLLESNFLPLKEAQFSKQHTQETQGNYESTIVTIKKNLVTFLF